jgi:hypothetical protein
MPSTKNIAEQFAIMHHAAQHPSPAVRRLASDFAKNLKNVNKLLNKNNVKAVLALKKMKKNKW